MRVLSPKNQKEAVFWDAVPLTGTMGISLKDKMPESCEPGAPEAVVVLAARMDTDTPACFLIVRKPGLGIKINGLPVLSVTALCDRDEISFGPNPEQRIFFSSESPKQIVPFHEGNTPVFCARSKTEIKEGMPAVRCDCGLWYAETPDLPAYTYAETCIGCGRPTTLGGVWEPPPVRKPVSFDVETYRHEVQRRKEELLAEKKHAVSLAG